MRGALSFHWDDTGYPMCAIPIRITDPPDPARRDSSCLLFACAEEKPKHPQYFSEEVVPSLAPAPKSAARRTQEAGGLNDLLGSSCECSIPLAGKIAAHLWLDLKCEMV